MKTDEHFAAGKPDELEQREAALVPVPRQVMENIVRMLRLAAESHGTSRIAEAFESAAQSVEKQLAKDARGPSSR